ncbi:MAG: putative tellurite resistance protein B-like protein [Pseudohongiellaceae bacterium]|jgi:uncharacterized tellurite resistance protein B-like protein
MLSTIKSFFDTKLTESATATAEKTTQQLNLASAALMIEVMNCDHQLDDREAAAFLDVLSTSLNLSQQELEELVDLAEKQAKQATSLYEFTRLINDHYDYAQKIELIENMWRIAFSDETLDKYEEHLIRKIADLIYVSHSDFIKSKLTVRDS